MTSYAPSTLALEVDQPLLRLISICLNSSNHLILRILPDESGEYVDRIATEVEWTGQSLFGLSTNRLQCSNKTSIGSLTREIFIAERAANGKDPMVPNRDETIESRSRTASVSQSRRSTQDDITTFTTSATKSRRSSIRTSPSSTPKPLTSLPSHPDYMTNQDRDRESSSAGEDLFPFRPTSDRRSVNRNLGAPMRKTTSSSSNHKPPVSAVPGKSSPSSSIRRPPLKHIVTSPRRPPLLPLPSPMIASSPISPSSSPSQHTRSLPHTLRHAKSQSSAGSSPIELISDQKRILPQILILEQMERLKPSVQQFLVDVLNEKRIRRVGQNGTEEVVLLPDKFMIVGIVGQDDHGVGGGEWGHIAPYLLDRFALSHTYSSSIFSYPSTAFSSTPSLPSSLPSQPPLSSEPFTLAQLDRVHFSPAAETFLNDLLTAIRLSPTLLCSRMMSARTGRELERMIRIWILLSRDEGEVRVEDILQILMSGVEHRLCSVSGEAVEKVVRRIVERV